MSKLRVIPVLFLREDILVKSVKFSKLNPIGDPIIAVQNFNELQVDELIVLDISATQRKRMVSIEMVKKIALQAKMPFMIGGGIRTLKGIEHVLQAGASRVVISSMAIKDIDFIRDAVAKFGSDKIVVCIDFKNTFLRGNRVYSHGGRYAGKYTPTKFAQLMEECGVGELIVQSIENDGTMNGYVLEMLQDIYDLTKLPLIALGGAGRLSDFEDVFKRGFVSGAAGSSLFIYDGFTSDVSYSFLEENSEGQLQAKKSNVE